MGRRKPGLWHSARKVEVQDVTLRHKKVCCVCGMAPKVRRLLVTTGVARAQTVSVYCIQDGLDWLELAAVEARRGKHYLSTGEGDIRGG